MRLTWQVASAGALVPLATAWVIKLVRRAMRSATGAKAGRRCWPSSRLTGSTPATAATRSGQTRSGSGSEPTSTSPTVLSASRKRARRTRDTAALARSWASVHSP